MIRNLLALLVAAILLVVGLMFSLVVLAIAAAVGFALWAYVAWNIHSLRRNTRKQTDPHRTGDVIEGESVVVERYEARVDISLPDAAPRP